MELKSGYKQTEVGAIPEDWRTDTLGNLTVLMTNGFVGTATRHYASNDNGILYIQGYNVEENSFNFHGIKYVTEEFHRAHMKSCLRGSDLLTVQTGEVGLTTIVPESLTGSNCHALIISRFDKKRVSSAFISYYLNSKPGRSRLKLIETGTTMKHLNVSDMLHFSVPLPPTKAEQEAIAEALGDADALIESLEQLIVKKRQIKQGAMQGLLTSKRRLPGFYGEWKQHTLRECILANPDYGINAPGVPQTGSLPTYLRITDIDEDGRFMPSNRVAVDHPFSMNYLLGMNEIVFARTGASVGKTYLYNANDGEVVFAGFLIRAKIDCSKLCPEFLAAYTKTQQYWNWVRVMSMRSGQPGINGNEYGDLELHLPPTFREQSAIAEILSDMDAEIATLEAKLAKARRIKQGMMQELLTGRIRLI
jgi:type I restriction enzyme S subunit